MKTRDQRLSELSEAALTSLRELPERALQALRDLTDDEQIKLAKAAQAGARTVGELTPDEFVGSISSAVTEGLRGALAGSGAGVVDRSKLALGSLADSGAGAEERGVDPGVDVKALEQRMSVTTRYAFESLPEIKRCKSAEERETVIRGYLLSQEWARVLSDGDRHRAERIAIATHPAHVQRAMASSTSAGVIPAPVQGAIVEKRALMDKITPRAMQYRSSTSTIKVPVEGVVINALGKAESADISTSANDPTHTGVTLTKQKATGFAAVPRELLFDADASVALVQNLASQAGRALGTYNNVQNATGDGTPPAFEDGILNNALVDDSTSGGAATRAMVLGVRQAIASEYREGGNLYWLADDATLGFLSLVEDTSGRPIYPNLNINQTQPLGGDEGGGYPRLEGIPVLVMPASAMSGVLCLANLDFFAALVEDSIRVESTTEGGTAFLTDQQHWKFVQRQDGAVTLPAGFAKTDAAVSAPV